MHGEIDYSVLDHPVIQFFYYAAIFWIPFYRWRHLSEAYAFLKVDWLLMMTLAALVIPYLLTKKQLPPRLRTNLAPFLLVFFALNVVASLLSPYPSFALGGIQTFIIAYLFIAFTQLVVNRQGYVRIFPVVLCTCISLSALLSVIGYFFQIDLLTLGVTTGIEKSVARGVGGSIGANNSALMYIFILPFLIHWAHFARSRVSKAFVAGELFLILLGIVSTFSRGGFLMLVGMIVLILWEERHRFHPRYLGLVFAAGGIVVMIGIAAIPDTFFKRVGTLGEGLDADMAMSRRAAYLKVGVDSFANNPVLGTGTDTFRAVWYNSLMSRRFKHSYRYAHNTYMEVLVGSGVLGLVAFLALLARSFLNYTQAAQTFRERGEAEMLSLTKAYRLSFICVITYLFILSAIEHKLLLLAIAFSDIALRMKESASRPESTVTQAGTEEDRVS